uniref:Uncharacterized protein n=1 Tax=Lepeophtheirus salmonis TaxID=72036 RepID=A0A0K2UGJ5_LEPSM
MKYIQYLKSWQLVMPEMSITFFRVLSVFLQAFSVSILTRSCLDIAWQHPYILPINDEQVHRIESVLSVRRKRTHHPIFFTFAKSLPMLKVVVDIVWRSSKWKLNR